MAYHVVFDISERYVELAIGVAAVLLVIGMLPFALQPGLRGLLRRASWLWLVAAAGLGFLFAVHDFGAKLGLVVGIPAAGAVLYVAVLALTNRTLPLRGGTWVDARFISPYAAVLALMFIAFLGYYQLPACSLSRQLAAGDATVTDGTVYATAEGGGRGGAWECFSLADQRYCYGTGFFDVGFHQTAGTGGPIRDGLQVRVSSIGGVIVRLEVADGQ